MVRDSDLIVVWFSCGAASAVAAKITLEKYGGRCRVRVVNNPVDEEHPDNVRFKDDVSQWLGVEIETAVNPKLGHSSAVRVWDREAFMSGVRGAPCTLQLKKQARYAWEAANSPDWHVLGFTADERARAERFSKFERENLLPVLVEAGITKADCFDILIRAGLDLPKIYGLGFPNANCIGCVKPTSPTYWNHVRKTFPDIFAARAEQSASVGAKLVRVAGKRIFLKDLSPDAKGRPMATLRAPDCGIFCEEK